MKALFHDRERWPRNVIAARPAAEPGQPAATAEEWNRMMGVVITALYPVAEARMAVVAALEAAENGVGPLR